MIYGLKKFSFTTKLLIKRKRQKVENTPHTVFEKNRSIKLYCTKQYKLFDVQRQNYFSSNHLNRRYRSSYIFTVRNKKVARNEEKKKNNSDNKKRKYLKKLYDNKKMKVPGRHTCINLLFSLFIKINLSG